MGACLGEPRLSIWWTWGDFAFGLDSLMERKRTVAGGSGLVGARSGLEDGGVMNGLSRSLKGLASSRVTIDLEVLVAGRGVDWTSVWVLRRSAKASRLASA